MPLAHPGPATRQFLIAAALILANPAIAQTPTPTTVPPAEGLSPPYCASAADAAAAVRGGGGAANRELQHP